MRFPVGRNLANHPSVSGAEDEPLPTSQYRQFSDWENQPLFLLLLSHVLAELLWSPCTALKAVPLMGEGVLLLSPVSCRSFEESSALLKKENLDVFSPC